MLKHTAYQPQRLAPLGDAVLTIAGRSAGLLGSEPTNHRGRWRS